MSILEFDVSASEPANAIQEAFLNAYLSCSAQITNWKQTPDIEREKALGCRLIRSQSSGIIRGIGFATEAECAWFLLRWS